MARTALGHALYRDTHGLEARVTVASCTVSKRFALDTPKATIRGWQEETRAARRRDSGNGQAGTIAEMIDAYLSRPDVKAKVSYGELQRSLMRWNARLGTVHSHARDSEIARHALVEAVRAALEARSRETCPNTANHDRAILGACWTAQRGMQAWNPVKDVPAFRLETPKVRGVSLEDVDRIVSALPPTPDAARIRLLAHTGLPPAQIGRLCPDDLDILAGTIRVPARHKGAGASARTLPLTARGKEAAIRFVQVGVYGAVPTLRLTRLFAKTVRGLRISNVRLYDLRHAFAARLYVSTKGNREVVAQFLCHAPGSKVTDRYVQSGVSAVLQDAVREMDTQVH